MKQKKQKFNSMVRLFGIIGLIFFAIFGGVAAVGCILAVAPLAWLSEKGEFKELKKEDLEKLSAEDLAGYFNAFNSAKWKTIEDKISAKAENKEVSELQKQFTENLNIQMKSLNDILIKQGLEIVKLKAGSTKPAGKKSIKDMLKENIDGLKALKSRDTAKSITIELGRKDIDTITVAGSVTGQLPVVQMEAGLNVIATRQPFIQQLISRGVATSTVIAWVEQRNKSGVVGGTTEGEKKNQVAFELVVVTEALVKRTVFIKVSEEMLEDIDFMASEINNELLRLLNLDVDAQILSGDNGTNNLNGITQQATAFSAGALAGQVLNANRWDALKAGVTQVINAYFNPNYIVLNPTDAALMEMEKSIDSGMYLMPPFQSANGNTISGVQVIINPGITAGKFLIMDGSRATAFYKQNVGIEIGWENDDFTRNLRTILAECRLLLRIKGNDKGAFVYGNFASAIAALDSGSTPS